MKNRMSYSNYSILALMSFSLLASCATSGRPADEKAVAEAAAADRVNSIVQEAGIDTVDEVKEYTVTDYQGFNPNGILVHFEFEKSELNPEAITALNKIVAGMKKDPLSRITIRGHADKQGTKDFNDRLSARRAKVIKEYLSKHGIENERLDPVSYGAAEPLEDTPTVKAYKKNRRGDFNINYGESSFGPAHK